MHIAEVAERMEQQYGQLTMTVLKPEQNTAEAVMALRASFLRRKLAPAGIWTVETGTKFLGLHLNILSPKPLHTKIKRCESYSEILRESGRAAAAYIAKRSGMPAREQYSGELWGSFGQIGQILVNQNSAPVVQAASVEVALSGGVSVDRLSANSESEYRTDQDEARGWREGEQFQGRRVWWCLDGSGEYTYKPPRPQLTREERAAIMRRNLPNLYAAIGKAVTA